MPCGYRKAYEWIPRGLFWATESGNHKPAEDQPRDPAAHEISLTVRDGPKWPPEAVVDIVVRILDGSGVAQLLASRNQKIQAADLMPEVQGFVGLLESFTQRSGAISLPHLPAHGSPSASPSGPVNRPIARHP